MRVAGFISYNPIVALDLIVTLTTKVISSSKNNISINIYAALDYKSFHSVFYKINEKATRSSPEYTSSMQTVTTEYKLPIVKFIWLFLCFNSRISKPVSNFI